MFLGKHLLVLLSSPVNGTLDAFGVVTRVWESGYVNLVVFPDASSPVVYTSVSVVADREAAQAARDAGNGYVIAYHPPRPS